MNIVKRVIYVEMSAPHHFLILHCYGPGLLCLSAMERQRMWRTSEVNTRSGGLFCCTVYPGDLGSSGSGGSMAPANSEVHCCTVVLLGASGMWAAVTELALGRQELSQSQG